MSQKLIFVGTITELRQTMKQWPLFITVEALLISTKHGKPSHPRELPASNAPLT